MATTNDTRKGGYNPSTKTYHSPLPPVPLPPLHHPLSVSSHALSLLHSPTTPPSSSSTFLIDASTDHRLTYSTFLQQATSLSLSLKPLLSKHEVAFILSPPCFQIPILYFSLISIGVVISPANPLSSPSELAHQIELSKPKLAFATSKTVHKLPRSVAKVVLLDSPDFQSMLDFRPLQNEVSFEVGSEVSQSDPAAILYSSGTTGKVKGVVITHRNLIAVISGMYYSRISNMELERSNGVEYVHPVSLFTLPLFHVFGFFMLIRAFSLGESVVLLEKFDFVKMLEAVQRYRVTYIPVTPPLVVAMAKSDLVDKYDLSSLEMLGCGGAPLGKEVEEKFRDKFPNVQISQGYGMTETSGGATRTMGPDDTERYGSAGQLAENLEAKIVDPESGQALPPGQRGELWLRGPSIMKGYAGDDAATAATLDRDGWLKTGDLCYFDEDGHLFVVDRLKELIKYKAYQVPPAELEQLLQSIPGIVDAAVIPFPDEDAGEIPMAYIVRKPDSTISATEIMEIIAKQVAPYKKIRRITFINSIPKSPAGKILRRELVNHAISSSPSRL